MKIVVLHGDDTVKSRDRYFKIIDTLKKRGWEHLPLRSEAKGGVPELLSGSSLFDTERIYTIDKPQKVAIKDYEWINKHLDEYQGSLLLYFDKNIPAAIKKLLPRSTKYEEFKLPQKLFVFLESVYPNNSVNSVRLLHEVLSTSAAELVLAMLARHLKDLYLLKIDPDFNLPDWRKRKLSSQLSKFKDNSLEKFIEDLSDADVKSKTGLGDLPLLLDLILIKL